MDTYLSPECAKPTNTVSCDIVATTKISPSSLTSKGSYTLATTGASPIISVEDSDIAYQKAYNILSLLNLYYVPVVIIVGIVGNTLSCAVFAGTYLHKRSSSYYLAALAVADTGFLLTLGTVWLAMAGTDLTNKDGWCQILLYVSSVTSFLSVWLIVSFTVERLIAVLFPLQRPYMCTVRRAKIVVVILSVSALCIYMFLLRTVGVVTVDGAKECTVKQEFIYTVSVMNLLDTVLTLIVPFVTLSILNSVIVYQVLIFSKMYRSKVASTKSHRSSLQSSKTHHSIAKLLLLLSTVFLVLNLPSYAIRVHMFVKTLLVKEPRMSDTEYILQQYFQLLYYTNFSLNFFLYAVYGVNFRKALVILFKKNIIAKIRSVKCFSFARQARRTFTPTSLTSPTRTCISNGQQRRMLRHFGDLAMTTDCTATVKMRDKHEGSLYISTRMECDMV